MKFHLSSFYDHHFMAMNNNEDKTKGVNSTFVSNKKTI